MDLKRNFRMFNLNCGGARMNKKDVEVLNKLALQYHDNPNNSTFNKIYTLISPTVENFANNLPVPINIGGKN